MGPVQIAAAGNNAGNIAQSVRDRMWSSVRPLDLPFCMFRGLYMAVPAIKITKFLYVASKF